MTRSPFRIRPLVRSWLPKTLRPHTILTGPLRGQRMVTSWHDYPAGIVGITERPLLSWLAANVKAGETWLDVGAHYGYTALALSRLVGRTGRVFAFEPMLTTVDRLEETRKLNGLSHLTVVPRGLGSPDTVATLNLPSTRGMADRTLTGVDSAPAESIEIARLDWLWPQISGSNDVVHGIKIDVQGMEMDALSGMRALLERQKPSLVVELHYGVDRDAFRALLESIGYETAATPIETEPSQDGQLRDNCSYAFAAAS
jgi:FkbM family methyltransferase